MLYFKGITAAKDYLREHEVTDEEMEDIVLRESVGTCIRCGDPLFPSDISGYAYQCFKCDEDFYASSKAEIVMIERKTCLWKSTVAMYSM